MWVHGNDPLDCHLERRVRPLVLSFSRKVKMSMPVESSSTKKRRSKDLPEDLKRLSFVADREDNASRDGKSGIVINLPAVKQEWSDI